MQALITGATGLVGSHLRRALARPVILGRDPERARRHLGDDVTAYAWQPEQGPPPRAAFDGVEVVFHLAGEPVAEGRWTPARKRAIRASRVDGTAHLVDALRDLPARPKVLVVASAVGFYGDRGDEELGEHSAPGDDFLAEVCTAWEAAAREATALGVRVVTARTGIVLSPRGGALARMAPPFRLGVGGPLGRGRQFMPWVHLEDVVGLYLHAARVDAVRGPLNVVSPHPVTNRVFAKTLGQVLHRPAAVPVPRFALRAAFGELSSVLVSSQRALPNVALSTGYRFRYPDLREALQACLSAP